MTDPAQRRVLTLENKFNANGMFSDAPAEQKAHFPAGDKSFDSGAGAQSGILEAGSVGWSSFQPMKHNSR